MNKNTAKKIKFIESVEKGDRNVLKKIIDKMLVKKYFNKEKEV